MIGIHIQSSTERPNNMIGIHNQSLSTTLDVYTNHIVCLFIPIILPGLSALLVVYTNHIVCLCIPIILFVCVYQSYCLASQYYWLCIPIILFGLSVLLVVYTNHIIWSLSTTLDVYINHIVFCLYQSYYLVSQYSWLCIPIMLFSLSVLLDCDQSYCLVSQYYWMWIPKHIVCLCIPIILFVGV